MTSRAPGSEGDLAELRKWHDLLVARVRQPIELPEPDLRLDLESRDSDRRRARHLHQMCLLHHAHFAAATRFKLPYLTSMYLWAAEAENPFGLYSSTRAIVEFSAFVHEVARRLQAVVPREEEWESRGRAYFDVVVRARFGTGDSGLTDRLREGAVNAEQLGLPKPIHVNDGLRSLAKVEAFAAVTTDYERLCDFVHHNVSSQAATADGYFIAHSATSPGGGEFRSLKKGPIIRYRYPARSPIQAAIGWTAPLALKHSRAVVEWHNSIPSSPFSPEELLELTGSEHGMEVEWPEVDRGSQRRQKIERNAPCPCGRGEKYKRCHGFS